MQFGKTLQKIEMLCDCSREEALPGNPAQGSEPCLATGFHVPAQLMDAQSATYTVSGKAIDQ